MTASTTSTRRGILAVALAVLLAMSVPSQALAADKFSFKGEGAFATWFLNDAHNTTVSVGAFDGQFHNPPGPPENAQNVFLSVSQSFCDEDNDELVFRDLLGAGDAMIDIDHARLSEAMAEGQLSLDGFEMRTPDCDDPDFSEPEFEDLGEFDVDVTDTWDGVGELHRSRSMFHFDGQGFKVRSHSMERFRDAEATGTLTGLDEFSVGPDLGESEFANIVSFKSSDVFIDQ